MRRYLQTQQAGTTWLSDRMDDRVGMGAFVEGWLREHDPHRKHPERTAKSYVLQDAESVSRRAKVRRALELGHAPLSLQHDTHTHPMRGIPPQPHPSRPRESS